MRKTSIYSTSMCLISLCLSPVFAGEVKTSKLSTYLADVKKRVERAWLPPRSCFKKADVILFKINANGMITDLKVSMASDSASFDSSVSKSIENAAPLPPLPKGIKQIVVKGRFAISASGVPTFALAEK